MCGAAKPKQVCMPLKVYKAEHKQLIKILKDAGKEGEKQEAEVKDQGGCGECGGAAPVLKPGMSLPEVILAHFNAGKNLEDMKVSETPKGLVTFALGWKPKPAERARVNKQFQTFNFLANGNMKAQRGRKFARDAEVLIGMLKDYQIDPTKRGGMTPSMIQKGIAFLTTSLSVGLGVAGIARAMEGNPEALALLFGASVTFVSGLLGIRAVDVQELRQEVNPIVGPRGPMPFPPPVIEDRHLTVDLPQGQGSALQTQILNGVYVGRLNGDADNIDNWYTLEDLNTLWNTPGQWRNPITRLPITGVTWRIANIPRDRSETEDATEATPPANWRRNFPPQPPPSPEPIEVVVHGTGKTHRQRHRFAVRG